MPDVHKIRRHRKRSLADLIVGGPAGFSELLQRLGPTFIKLGQFLALRPDIVPQEYCDELMGLLDRVPPFPWDDAKAILTEHLGKDPTEVFDFVNPRPAAAGSLAQVHFARLKNGNEVAIKIQRPNIERRVRRDLRRAGLLARLLELGHVSLIVSPKDLFEELRDWVMQEIDLTRELSNLSKLSDLTANSCSQRVPQPYPELCGKRVLVTEFLRGVAVSEVLVAMRSGQPKDRELVADLGVDWNAFAENLMRATLTQIFDYHFFHADVHPGNLLVLAGDVIGYVDFGLCDKSDETVQKEQLRYLSAVYNSDVDQMFKALMDVLVAGPESDVESFRMDFVAEAKIWLTELARHDNAELQGRSPIAQWMIGVMRAARKHGFQVPTRILSMYRALLTAETVATGIAPDADLQRVGQEFFTTVAWEEVVRTLQPKNLQNIVLTILGLLKDSPGQFRRILADLSENRFILNTKVSEDPKVERLRNRRTRLLVTSVLTVGVAILVASPRLPTVFGVTLAWPLYTLLGFLYVSVLVQWRGLR